MPRKKNNDLEELLALPHVHARNGVPYARIYYRNSAGTWRTKSRRVHMVEEAIAAVAEIQRELGARGPSAFEGERMTFAELLAEYTKAKQIAPWYEEPIKAFFGAMKIKAITYGDIQRFKASRESIPNEATGKPRSTTTINRELEPLRAVLGYAEQHEWISRSPFNKGAPLIRKSQEKKRRRIPSPGEEAAILTQCIGPREHLRPILIGLKDTGLRKSALLSLEWKNVDLEGGFLNVPPSSNQYKKRPDVIGVTARLRVELLGLWEKSDQKPETKIFGDLKDFKRSYKTACRLAGVKGLRVHDWRHGFATDMAEAGVDERMAMIATGHTSAEIHAMYTNLDQRLAKSIAERLDELHRSRQGSEASLASEMIN